MPERLLALSRNLARVRRVSISSEGFSLVELLAVIAVIAILAAALVPAIPSLIRGKGIERATEDLSGLLELARTHAIANQTYVFVGFEDTQSFGADKLLVGAVSSLDGSSTVSSSNLKPISKIQGFDDLKLATLSALPSALRQAASDGDVDDPADYVATFGSNPSFNIGNQAFDGPTVTISPQGEILPNPGARTFRPKINVGLALTRGGTPIANEPNGSIITYYGGTGRIEVTRP